MIKLVPFRRDAIPFAGELESTIAIMEFRHQELDAKRESFDADFCVRVIGEHWYVLHLPSSNYLTR